MTVSLAQRNQVIREIIRAYDDRRVRCYARIRFFTFRRRMLDELGQYLPRSGLVLDVGCGFGLFTLYFATLFPELQIRGLDVNPRRVALAAAAARRLRLTNVAFEVRDACELDCAEPIQGACLIDLVHHMPREVVPRLLQALAAALRPGCRLLVKDLGPAPAYKLAYTWALDKLMDYPAPLHYWSPTDVRQALEPLGLRVYQHDMSDFLPCPHVLYIAGKPDEAPGTAEPRGRP